MRVPLDQKTGVGPPVGEVCVGRGAGLSSPRSAVTLVVTDPPRFCPLTSGGPVLLADVSGSAHPTLSPMARKLRPRSAWLRCSKCGKEAPLSQEREHKAGWLAFKGEWYCPGCGLPQHSTTKAAGQPKMKARPTKDSPPRPSWDRGLPGLALVEVVWWDRLRLGGIELLGLIEVAWW